MRSPRHSPEVGGEKEGGVVVPYVAARGTSEEYLRAKN